MRVCMIAYTVYEVDNRVMRYAETLARRGDYVEVICLRRQKQEPRGEINGVHVSRIQVRLFNERGQFSFLLGILRFLVQSMFVVGYRHLRKPYDLIHVHSVPDFLVFAAWIPKLTGCRVILDIHDLLPEFYASKFSAGFDSFMFRLLLLTERLSTAFADHVIIANDLWHEKLVLRSVPIQKCTVFLNYPDRSHFHLRGRTRSHDKFIMMFPGSLNWHQGLDLAIRAFHRIRDQAPQAEFHIYGDGGDRDSLEQLIRDLGDSDRIFLRDPRPIDQIANLIENSDLGIVPKRKESFGNEAFSTKILEFMSLGIPVVVADTAIDRFYFNDSVVQFFRGGDEADLARAILQMIRNPELRSRLATNSLEFVKHFDWETKSREYLALADSPMQ